MIRGPKVIAHGARLIGQHAEKQTVPDHTIVRALCELLAELAESVHRLESDLHQLKHHKL
jgi:hypothetical protein